MWQLFFFLRFLLWKANIGWLSTPNHPGAAHPKPPRRRPPQNTPSLSTLAPPTPDHAPPEFRVGFVHGEEPSVPHPPRCWTLSISSPESSESWDSRIGNTPTDEQPRQIHPSSRLDLYAAETTRSIPECRRFWRWQRCQKNKKKKKKKNRYAFNEENREKKLWWIEVLPRQGVKSMCKKIGLSVAFSFGNWLCCEIFV